MTGLVMKIIICPIGVWLSDYLFTDVYYNTVYEAIIVGLVLAVLAHFMEVMLLRRGTFWISTVIDFVVSFAIVYMSQLFFHMARITAFGALLTASILTITEYFQHMYLINSGKTEKSE